MTARWLFAALLLTPAAAAQPVPMQSGAALPRLAGIVIGAGHRTAIFEAATGTSAMAEEGEQVQGYTIRAISRDGVVLDGAGGSVTLLPSPRNGPARTGPADAGGATFGLVVNPQTPAPD